VTIGTWGGAQSVEPCPKDCVWGSPPPPEALNLKQAGTQYPPHSGNERPSLFPAQTPAVAPQCSHDKGPAHPRRPLPLGSLALEAKSILGHLAQTHAFQLPRGLFLVAPLSVRDHLLTLQTLAL
jgi:hypothetical protein